MRKQKGITLIALVITIVVLIILAGVAINMTLGENGVFKKAEYARQQHKMAEVKEKVELSILDIQTEKIGDGGTATIDDIVAELPNKLSGLTITKDGEKAKGTYNDCDFTIDSNLNVTINGYNPSAGGSSSGGAHTHSYTETITKEATCTEAGEKTLTCSCGDTKTETIPAPGHNYESGMCTGCKDINIPVSEIPEGYDASIENWNYTLDEENKTVTLNYHIFNTDCRYIYVPATYTIDSERYLTQISSNTSGDPYSDYMFNANLCNNLRGIIFDKNIDTSNVTNMSGMFYGCDKITELDLSSFKTTNVTSMAAMFEECRGLTNLMIDFDTRKVTNMSKMFAHCSKLSSLDPSKFITINVTDMSYMFYYCEELTTLKIEGFETNNVTDMSCMFCCCSALESLDVSNFVTNKVTKMNNMFSFLNKIDSLDVTNFDTSNVTDMSNMFNGCDTITELDLSSFDTRKVTEIKWMLAHCRLLTKVYVGEYWEIEQANEWYSVFVESGTSEVTKK